MFAVIFSRWKRIKIRLFNKVNPKPMVKIGGKPIIWHLLKILNSQMGLMILLYVLDIKEM